jgi:hypothetical protein
MYTSTPHEQEVAMTGPQHPQAPGGPPKIAPMPTIKHEELDLEPIDLVEDSKAISQKIRAFGNHTGQKAHQWKRQPVKTGQGAIRVRSFHGKLSDQGLGYLDDAVNNWLDEHPEVEVKFVTQSVGTFEGKIREPALVLNLWY